MKKTVVRKCMSSSSLRFCIGNTDQPTPPSQRTRKTKSFLDGRRRGKTLEKVFSGGKSRALCLLWRLPSPPCGAKFVTSLIALLCLHSFLPKSLGEGGRWMEVLSPNWSPKKLPFAHPPHFPPFVETLCLEQGVYGGDAFIVTNECAAVASPSTLVAVQPPHSLVGPVFRAYT